MSITWEDLFEVGSLFDVNIGWWSGRTQLTCEDLGIEETPEVRAAMTLGHERLVPKEAMEKIYRINSQARQVVEKASLPFSLVQGARFVPATKKESLGAKLEEFKTEFQVAVQEFLDNYAAHKAAMLPLIQKALRDAAKTPEIAETAIARILQEYPTSEQLVKKFKFSWHAFRISLPKDGGTTGAVVAETEEVRQAVLAMLEQLRTEAYETIVHIIELVNRGGKLHGKTVNAAKETAQRLQELNFFQDKVLADSLTKLVETIETFKDNKEQVVVGLKQIAETLDAERQKGIDEAEEKIMGLGKREISL